MAPRKTPRSQSATKNNLTTNQKAALLLDIGYAYLYSNGELKSDLDSGRYYAGQLDALGKQTNNVHDLQKRSCSPRSPTWSKRFPGSRKRNSSLNDTMRLKAFLSLTFFNTNTASGNLHDQAAIDQAARYARKRIPHIKNQPAERRSRLRIRLCSTRIQNATSPPRAEKYHRSWRVHRQLDDRHLRAYDQHISLSHNKDGTFTGPWNIAPKQRTHSTATAAIKM